MFRDQCCIVDVKEKSTEQCSESSSSDTQKISILMDGSSENIFNEELDKLLLVKMQFREKLFLGEYNMEIQNLEQRNSEYALVESERELEPQR